jgi:hypothetical protein
MIKSAILAAAVCFAFVVPASAQQTAKCDQATLTKMRADIDAMTDQDKKAKSLESWTAADAAFKANNMAECNAKLGETDTGKGMGGVGGEDAGSATTTN